MKIQLTKSSFRRILQASVRLVFVVGISSILLIASGEATAKKKTKKVETEEVKEYVWPAAPQQAVIKFTQEFNSEEDLKPAKKKSRWKDTLLGKEEEKSSRLVSPYSVDQA